MKLNKTFFFALVTLIVILAVYLFDYKAEMNNEKIKQALILDYDVAQVSYIHILKPDINIGLQKSQSGWDLLEPIQDSGDNENVEELLNSLANEKQISVVMESETALTEKDLQEYGLDKPAAIFNFKNNLGHTKKITVGSVKNYEGNSYLRVDSQNRIIIADSVWFAKSEKDLIHYREKKLYRHSLAKIIKIKVKSLRDSFELKLVDGKWVGTEQKVSLDQNHVRELLKKLAETNIVQYVFEGEPSSALVTEKGLDKSPVRLELQTNDSTWSVSLNQNVADKALYALTESPTFLVKIDLPAWEYFGNLNLDQLRDRSSALAFNIDEVQKIYFKENDKELDFISAAGKWKVNSKTASTSIPNESQIKKTLGKIHDIKISEFIDEGIGRKKFEGKNMLILKSVTDKLVLQLNWGPSFKIKKYGDEKEYYYARTQLSDTIFALDKKLIDSLDFDKILTLKQVESEKINEKSGEKIEN